MSVSFTPSPPADDTRARAGKSHSARRVIVRYALSIIGVMSFGASLIASDCSPKD